MKQFFSTLIIFLLCGCSIIWLTHSFGGHVDFFQIFWHYKQGVPVPTTHMQAYPLARFLEVDFQQSMHVLNFGRYKLSSEKVLVDIIWNLQTYQ